MVSKNIRNVTDQDFDSEVLKSPIPVLVYFKANWAAAPFQALQPIVNNIANDYEGKVKVCALDIDDSPETTSKYGVKSVPTCLVFQTGQKTGSLVGSTSYGKMLKFLNLS